MDVVAGTRRLPWWMVADPHGTQMASLVQRVNPYCRLYPVRIGRGRNDFEEEAAIKVRLVTNLRLSQERRTNIGTTGPQVGTRSKG